MLSPDRKPGKKLVTDRLQAQRIGSPSELKSGYKNCPHGHGGEVIRCIYCDLLAEADKVTREAAGKE